MPTDFRSVYAKCPFYDTEDNKGVTCEGITRESALVLRFRGRAHKDRHTKHFCDDMYERCMIYRMLMEKYED